MEQNDHKAAYNVLIEGLLKLELHNAFQILAECAYESGQFEEVPRLVAASRVVHGEEHALHFEGLALLKRGKFAEAYLFVQDALKLYPSCPKLHDALSQITEAFQAQLPDFWPDLPHIWQYQVNSGDWAGMTLAQSLELEAAFAHYQANPQVPCFVQSGRGVRFCKHAAAQP